MTGGVGREFVPVRPCAPLSILLPRPRRRARIVVPISRLMQLSAHLSATNRVSSTGRAKALSTSVRRSVEDERVCSRMRNQSPGSRNHFNRDGQPRFYNRRRVVVYDNSSMLLCDESERRTIGRSFAGGERL